MICNLNLRIFAPKGGSYGKTLEDSLETPGRRVVRTVQTRERCGFGSAMAGMWLLRRGERLIRVKVVVGVIYWTIQRRVRWYEAGGIAEVGRHKSGSMKTHRQAWTAEQEAKLKEAVSEGRFRTVGEAVRWCAEVLGIEVSEGKVYHWFRRWGYRKKVPRP